MNQQQIATELVQIVESLIEPKDATQKSRYSILREVREAQDIAAGLNGAKVVKSAIRVNLDKIPGFGPQQLRAAIDKIVGIRQRLQQMHSQYDAALKKLKNLEDDEKKGAGILSGAAAQMKQKIRHLVEAENGLLDFTAFLQEKRSGIEQMISDPDTSKLGDKTGDFFGRIGAKLGKNIILAVKEIARETEEDITHGANAIRGLKLVAKTASVKESSLKKAGLADMAVSVKEWLAGRADNMIQRIINFAGDIQRFVKGFTARTAIVKKETGRLLGSLKDAKNAIDSALA